jgi:hypothetical protein
LSFLRIIAQMLIESHKNPPIQSLRRFDIGFGYEKIRQIQQLHFIRYDPENCAAVLRDDRAQTPASERDGHSRSGH